MKFQIFVHVEYYEYHKLKHKSHLTMTICLISLLFSLKHKLTNTNK